MSISHCSTFTYIITSITVISWWYHEEKIVDEYSSKWYHYYITIVQHMSFPSFAGKGHICLSSPVRVNKFIWMPMTQCYSWGGAMGHRPIQQKNGPLTKEIAILNLERMAHWNFKFIGNKWKMAHTIVCPAITLMTVKNKNAILWMQDLSAWHTAQI